MSELAKAPELTPGPYGPFAWHPETSHDTPSACLSCATGYDSLLSPCSRPWPNSPHPHSSCRRGCLHIYIRPNYPFRQYMPSPYRCVPSSLPFCQNFRVPCRKEKGIDREEREGPCPTQLIIQCQRQTLVKKAQICLHLSLSSVFTPVSSTP